MRLLIVPCGAKKKRFRFLAPAIDVYDGPTYKVIRNAIQLKLVPNDLHILILSAKYGLILLNQPIEFYEQKMDPYRAHELSSQCEEYLDKYIKTNSITRVYLSLSQLYQKAVLQVLLKQEFPIVIEGRGLGFKLQFVKRVMTGKLI